MAFEIKQIWNTQFFFPSCSLFIIELRNPAKNGCVHLFSKYLKIQTELDYLVISFLHGHMKGKEFNLNISYF